MKFFRFISVVVFTTLNFITHAQISTNGIVDINPYAGLQPDLIKGVTALPATGAPVIRHVYLIDRKILALTIDEKSIVYSNLKPYVKQDGDTMIMSGYHGMSKQLVRKGDPIGFLCGFSNSWYRPFNQMAGEKLDIAWTMNPSNYRLILKGDLKNVTGIAPMKVNRKSYLNGKKHVSLKDDYTLRHEIYLTFQSELKQGGNYTLDFNEGSQFKGPVSFTYNERIRSEAIHVNMAGYEPEDSKIAFVSMWLGDGGGYEYPGKLKFQVVDAIESEVVFSGTSKIKQKGSAPEYKIGNKSFNHNLTDIHTLDFSGVQKAGKYRLVVSGIGSSFDFEISDNIWDLTSRLLMKGFLHQRSGMELGPPYTNYQRPRNMHTHDEFIVHTCDVEKFFNLKGEGSSQNNVFDRIKASILMDTRVKEAWGGWMDAGDFDQRMGHLFSVRRMMYLYELNPEYFESYNLNIPESSNDIPDILDEGAWCLDLYRRTQGVYEEGGISWWVESVTHPRQGEPSWLNSLPTALIPPTPRACLHYAATAAQMSLTIKKYDPELANEYLESALAAMKWVVENVDAPDPYGSNPRPVIEALAYVNLYRTTGDKVWHKRFIKRIKEIFPNGLAKGVNIRYGELYATYLLIKENKTDPEMTRECEEALVILADGLLEGANQTAFDIPKLPDEEMGRMVTLGRKILPIVMAHKVTDDQKYTDALNKTMQYTMGANPMNRTYISGLGERTFMPYHLDWEADNLHIPSGIPNFGPTIQTETKWGWRDAWSFERIQDAGLYPDKLIEWPFIEKCFNKIWEAPTNEFTVRSPMGELLLLTGYLAQERAD